MKILMVLTSHDQLGETGNKTGFWLEEFAAPYYVFKDAGAEITLASPKGGQPPLDPSSDADAAQTEATRRFKSDEAGQQTARRRREDHAERRQHLPAGGEPPARLPQGRDPDPGRGVGGSSRFQAHREPHAPILGTGPTP